MMAVTESDHRPVGFYAARAPNADSVSTGRSPKRMVRNAQNIHSGSPVSALRSNRGYRRGRSASASGLRPYSVDSTWAGTC
jgi:hypothetical protein